MRACLLLLLFAGLVWRDVTWRGVAFFGDGMGWFPEERGREAETFSLLALCAPFDIPVSRARGLVVFSFHAFRSWALSRPFDRTLGLKSSLDAS